MNEGQQEIEQLREDLATVKQATGTELPFGWADVYGEVGAALVLLLGAVGLGIVPVLVYVVLWAIVLRARLRRGSGRSPVRRKALTATLLLMAPMVVAVVLYAWYLVKFLLPRLDAPLVSGISVGMGSVFFGIGLALVFSFVVMPQQRSNLPAAGGALLLGLLMPVGILWRLDIVRMGLGVLGICVALTAWIEARALQRAGIPHGTD